MEKDEALELLNDFKNNLQEFKKLLISSKHPTMSKIASNHELINELREKVVYLNLHAGKALQDRSYRASQHINA